MLELFRVEADNQTAILTSGLLALERDPAASLQLEMLMRAAHSLKGAARIVNLHPAVRLAHALEDCFVAAQRGVLHLRQQQIDLLFRAVDLLQHLARQAEENTESVEGESQGETRELLESLARLAGTDRPQPPASPPLAQPETP